MYKYIYIIIPQFFPKVKIGYWSGKISELKARYKMYYGEFEIYFFQYETNLDKKSILKGFEEQKWVGELYESSITEEFMILANDITIAIVLIWKINLKNFKIKSQKE